MDLGYAKALGVDLNHLLFTQPDDGVACFQIAEALLKQGLVKVIVFDSVSTMISRQESEGEMGEADYVGKLFKYIPKFFKIYLLNLNPICKISTRSVPIQNLFHPKFPTKNEGLKC